MGVLGYIETNQDPSPDVLLTNWLDDISTRAMALWACSTLSEIVNAMIDAIGDGFLRNVLDAEYRESFKQPSRIVL